MRTLNLIFLLLFALAFEISYAQPGGPLGDPGSQGVQLENQDISKSISIYPNPATDFVIVKSPALNAHQVKLTVFNILGNEMQTEIEVIDDHEVRVRVKEFSAGYYLIAVRDEKIQFKGTYKFLKR